MQENPPYSIATIRLLLSQYLDGMLDSDQLVEVELLLDRYPHYQTELLNLQKTRGVLHDALQDGQKLSFNKVSETTWKNIAAQLQADHQSEAGDVDFEFISAYYDGELDPNDPARSVFEEQLFQNDAANQVLADTGALSEAIRNLAYRQEEACPIDLTKQVMQAYVAEVTDSEAEALVLPEMEMLSAFVDQELSAKEIIELNRVIERDDCVRQSLGIFNQLSDAIRGVGQQLELQAPTDFWTRIETVLLADAKAKVSDNVLAFPVKSRSASQDLLKKVGLPAVAAAVLVLLSIPALRDEGALPNTSLASSQNEYNQVQLASVPLSTSGPGFMTVSTRTPMRDTSTQGVTLPNERLALQANSLGRDTGSDRQIPSSEEYLFRALEEQSPDADMSHILGK